MKTFISNCCIIVGSILILSLNSAQANLIHCSALKSVKQQNADPKTIKLWVKKQVEKELPDPDKVRYLSGSADLNNDCVAEHFVLIQDRYYCGSGGCAAYIFNNEGKVINRMSVTNAPVLLAKTYSNGWRDFIVWSDGAYRLMKYDGKSYPSNPSLQPKLERDADMKKAMAAVMKTELYQQDGYGIQQTEAKVLWKPANQYHFTFKHYGNPDNIYHAVVKNGKVSIKPKVIADRK